VKRVAWLVGVAGALALAGGTLFQLGRRSHTGEGAGPKPARWEPPGKTAVDEPGTVRGSRGPQKNPSSDAVGDQQAIVAAELRKASAQLLTNDPQQRRAAETVLRSSIGKVVNRIMDATEGSDQRQSWERLRKELVAELGAIIDNAELRQHFPDAIATLLNVIGTSQDPAAIPVLIRTLDFTVTTDYSGPPGGTQPPALRALLLFDANVAPLVVASAIAEARHKPSAALVAEALSCMCRGRREALTLCETTLPTVTDAGARSRLLAIITVLQEP
jgi:hypothetical protein